MTAPDSIDPQLVAEYTAGRVPADTVGLQKRIDAVLASLKGHCGWVPFPVRVETFHLDGVGQQLLVLPTKKLREVTKLVVLGTEIPADQIEWSENGLVYLRNLDNRRIAFPHRLRSIEIEIQHGYEVDECYDLLDSVAGTIDRAVFNPRGATQIRVGERQTSFSPGSGGQVIGTRPLGEDMATWDAYKLPPVSWEGG